MTLEYAVRPELRLDLCSGRRGWERRGHWIAVDNDSRMRPDLLADVRGLRGSWLRWASLVVASPPCGGFTDLPWRPATGEGVDVLLACLALCEESGAPWCLENTRFAQEYIGKARCHWGGFYLWGPLAKVPDTPPPSKMAISGNRPDLRAMIPEALALAVCP